MTAKDYVQKVMREFPDNEMSASDLWDWQGETKEFARNTIYYALLELEKSKKVVRGQLPGEKSVYWAGAR